MSEHTRPQVSCGPLAADQQSGRDLRLDLFRGLSLLFIFIDHIPNNLLSYVTLHSIAFSDAAEVFVFISGYAAATVYSKAFERQGFIAVSGRIYRRVLQLYVAHILTFVVLVAGLCYVALRLQNQTYIEDFGIDYFIDEPGAATAKFLLLQYQPQFLDILPIYMIFSAAVAASAMLAAAPAYDFRSALPLDLELRLAAA